MKKMQKLLLLPLVVALSGCTYINLFDDGEKTEPEIEIPTEQGVNKINARYTYKEYSANNAYPLSSCPSVGSPKLLVIPIWFEDSTNYIDLNKRETVRKDIQNAYFGTSIETGWESVSSYYKKDSFGKLDLSGTVSEWYECGYDSDRFYEEEAGMEATVDLVSEATEWYFSNHSDSRKSYDFDGDGYLDGVMLIYASPDYASMDNDYASNMWAYCYWVQSLSKKNVNKPGENVFFWASYDFMYSSGIPTRLRVGSFYGGGDNSICEIDAHTYIHEMGHVFGLSDYYDYTGKASPAGGFSMQDMNVGGHDPYSRFSLGWANPYLPTETTELVVRDIESSGECVVLAYDGYDGSPFDEYIIIELYTPYGLNEFDSKYAYGGAYPKGPKAYGARVWHIDSRLFSYTTNKVTTSTKAGYVTHATTNTSSGKKGYSLNLAGRYEYNQNHLIRAKKSETYSSASMLSESSLFMQGDKFSLSDYSSQFYNGKFNSGVTFNWEVEFKEIAKNGMKIVCTKK